ncbi:MAG: TonB-dependent receptor [bacterium]
MSCLSVSPLFSQEPQIETSRQFETEESLRRWRPTEEDEVSEEEKKEKEKKEKEGMEYASPSPGDEDLGVQMLLKRREEYKPLTLFGDASAFYTSNATLVKDNAPGDWFWVGRVGASYQPRILPNLLGEATVQQQFFRYDEFKNLDFDSMNVGGGLTYIIQEFWDIAVFGRYNFNRLTYGRDTINGEEDDEFFKNHTMTFGLQKIFPLARAHYLYIGHTSQLAISEPSALQRNDYSLFAGYNVKLTRDIEAQAGYRFAYFDYNFRGREDLNQTASLGATYKPIEWVSLFTSLSVGLNNSNQPANDYKVYNAGGGFGVQVKF